MFTKSSNRVLLEWTEPGIPRRFWLKRLQPRDWLRLVVGDFAKWFLIIAGFMLFGTLIYHKLGLVDILAWSAVCLLPMVALDVFAMLVNPVQIALREKGIERRGVDGAFHVDYKDIQRCALKTQDFGNATARALDVWLINGNEAMFEIAPKITLNAICRVLSEKGIEVEITEGKPEV